MLKKFFAEVRDSRVAQILLFAHFLYFVFLFLQLFEISSSYEVLILREVDDIAFQHSLRKIHNMWGLLEFGRGLRMNDYAYGSLFWNVHALATYPFYLLRNLIGESPLIVSARMISFLFSYLGLVYLFKILKYFRVKTAQALAILLLFCSFPTFAYFSQRFGTVAMVFCFSVSSIYYALQLDGSKDSRKKLIWAFALCVGTKLSGILIAPVIALLVFFHYFEQEKKSFLEALTNTMVLAFKSSLLGTLLMAPGLFAGVIKFEYATAFLNTLSHHLGTVSTGQSTFSFADNFLYGVFSFSLSPILYFCLAVLFLIYAFKDWLKEKTSNHLNLQKFILIFSSVILALVLAYKIKMGTSYTANYSSVFSFLFLVPFLSLLRFRNSLVLVLFLGLMNLYINRSYIFDSLYSINFYYKKAAKPETRNKILLIDELRKIISPEDKRILIHSSMPAPYVSLGGFNQEAVYYFSSFENLSKGPYDHIIFAKQSDFVKQAKAENPRGSDLYETLIDRVDTSSLFIKSLEDEGVIVFSRKK